MRNRADQISRPETVTDEASPAHAAASDGSEVDLALVYNPPSEKDLFAEPVLGRGDVLRPAPKN